MLVYSLIYKGSTLCLNNTNIDNTNIAFAFHAPIYQTDMDVFYIDFFKEFIGSGITSLLMEELREKRQWIYNVGLDNYTSPYGTFLVIEIATKNKHIRNVIDNTLKILKRLASGKFKENYLEYVKKAYMVEHYETCLNNSYFDVAVSINKIRMIAAQCVLLNNV